MSDSGLSQDEIDALMSNNAAGGSDSDSVELTPDEIDTIGEVGNISMGTASTALFALVNKKVEISTPVVTISTWDELVEEYDHPCVLIKIQYTKGLNGTNMLVLKENDVKIITDLMMGGEGSTDGEITEIHLSAISEAMNQMMGSSATSLSSMLNKVVDISPPTSNLIDLHDQAELVDAGGFQTGKFVKIEFRLQIGDLVDSSIMELFPIPLAKEMVHDVIANMATDSKSTIDEGAFEQVDSMDVAQPVPPSEMEMNPIESQQPQMQKQPQMQQTPPMGMPMQQTPPVNVQQAQFTPFAGSYPMQYSPENIDLIMDVPLEVTAELGRTHKSIQEILDFAPGTIIELNKIAGEPIDVLVNGKYVAKGEVVVIEESFGIRITEIMK